MIQGTGLLAAFVVVLLLLLLLLLLIFFFLFCFCFPSILQESQAPFRLTGLGNYNNVTQG